MLYALYSTIVKNYDKFEHGKILKKKRIEIDRERERARAREKERSISWQT